MDLLTKDLLAYERMILQRIKSPPLPPAPTLKDPDVQEWLSRYIFTKAIAADLGFVYMKEELKRIINILEKAIRPEEDEVVSDALYELLADIIPIAAHEDPLEKRLIRYSRPIYPTSSSVSQPTSISILEKPLVIGSGSDTGNRTWEASLRLLHYLEAHPHIIKGKRVLEIGAGSGLVTIYCAAFLSPKQILGTDNSPAILDAFRKNIELNSDLWTDLRPAPTAAEYDISDLDKGDLQSSPIIDTFIPDIILGADILYHLDLATSIGRGSRLNIKSSANPGLEFYLAATQRRMDTLDEFERQFQNVTKGNLAAEPGGCQMARITDWQPLPWAQQKGLYHIVNQPIRLYHLHKSILNTKP